VSLEPGESRQVTITLDQRAFSFWSELLGTWVVEAGEFAVEVGRHSRDLPLARSVTIDAPAIAPPLTADSTLHEWMADPTGLALIREAVAAGQPDPTRDPELVSVIGTMPMSTLAAFQGMSVDHDTLDKLVERVHAR
jgi:beta-glucosidase